MSLQIPEEEKREQTALQNWYSLFFINQNNSQESGIFDILRNGSQIENFKNQLQEWDVWQKEMAGEKDFCFSVNQWSYQKKRANALIQLLELGRRYPSSSSKEDFDHLLLELSGNNGNSANGLPTQSSDDQIDPNWKFSAFLLLKDLEREYVQEQQIKVLLESGDGERGILSDLTINLYENGNGKIFPNPKRSVLLNYGDKFLASVNKVWECLLGSFSTIDKDNRLSKIDASFTITSNVSAGWRKIPQFLWGIDGYSATAAIYLCLYQSLKKYLGQPTNFELNNRFFAITAEMGLVKDNHINPLDLFEVGGIENKIRKAVDGGMEEIIVALPNQKLAEAALLNISDDRARRARIVGCSDIRKVIEHLAEQVKEKQVVITSEHDNCKEINWLGKRVPMGKNYQLMPMLITIKYEKLLHESRKEAKDNDNKNERDRFRELTPSQWEEEILRETEKYVTESSHSISDVFNNFQRILASSSSAKTVGEVPRFVLLGSPGGGKTTFCKYLSWGCGEDELKDTEEVKWKLVSKDGIQLVPAQIKLPEWEKAFSLKPEYKHLHIYLESRFQSAEKNPTSEQWKDWLLRGEVLLLFDGLDEVLTGENELLKNAITSFPNCPTLITCRTVSFETHQDLIPDFPIFTLAGLTETQQKTLISSYLKLKDTDQISRIIDWLDENPNLQLLAANPLLLTIICFVIEDILEKKKDLAQALPKTRSALYQAAIYQLLDSEYWTGRDHSKIKFTSEKYNSPEKKQSVLELVALDKWKNNENDRQLVFSNYELIESLEEQIKKQAASNPESVEQNASSLFLDLSEVCGIFIRGGKTQKRTNYRFLHLTIQEFLVASCLAKDFPASKSKINIRGFLGDSKSGGYNLYDVNWSEVLAMLGGTLAILDEKENSLVKGENDQNYSPRAESYIASLLEENKQDMFYRPFFTAVAAAVEAGDKIKPETKKYLFDESMKLYFNPPDYLENEFFMPLIRLWNNDAVEFLRGKLRDYLDDHEPESD